MRDGRVDVYDSGCGVQNTVTIDTHRHGRLPQKPHSPFPLGERNALLIAPLSKVLLRYFWKSNKTRRCAAKGSDDYKKND